LFLLLSALIILASFGCGNQPAPAAHESAKREQVLPLTYGGFLEGDHEAEKLDGACWADNTRLLLNCDFYNGLPGWTISEVLLRVAWLTRDNVRDYRIPIIIKPLTTEHVTVRLGQQLPPEPDTPRELPLEKKSWTWLILGAKGYP
jgi:hypothetical protein